MKYIKSPLNYTGGKYKLLGEIFNIFPEDIRTFVDLFAGGFNVGINITSEKIICNDQIGYLIDLFEFLKATSVEDVISEIKERINEFQLNKENEVGYKKLRDRYNLNKDIMDFFVLTFYSFNHQIRFNNSQKFNSPFGKNRSSYNKSIENNLISFCAALKRKNIIFSNKDFLDIDLTDLNDKDLIYCDPPYLISNGSYNDGNRGFKDWTLKEEEQLLNLLDKLNDKGVRFALSNVLSHKGMKNYLLNEWSSKYKIYYIENTYSNCNYHIKEKNAETIEIIVTNF